MSRQPDAPGGDVPDRDLAMRDLIDSLRLFTVESDVFVDVFARAHGLGRSDLNAIMWISTGDQDGQPVTAGQLAANLGMAPSAITALIDRLEGAGHVQRVRGSADRRRVTLVMQPKALQMAKDFFGPLGRSMGQAVAGASTEELQRSAEIVRMMITAVVETRHRSGTEPGTLIAGPER